MRALQDTDLDSLRRIVGQFSLDYLTGDVSLATVKNYRQSAKHVGKRSHRSRLFQPFLSLFPSMLISVLILLIVT